MFVSSNKFEVQVQPASFFATQVPKDDLVNGTASAAAPAGLMLEGLLPNGRQREPARLDSEDTSRKVAERPVV